MEVGAIQGSLEEMGRVIQDSIPILMLTIAVSFVSKQCKQIRFAGHRNAEALEHHLIMPNVMTQLISFKPLNSIRFAFPSQEGTPNVDPLLPQRTPLTTVSACKRIIRIFSRKFIILKNGQNFQRFLK